jgi:hypothetical protein
MAFSLFFYPPETIRRLFLKNKPKPGEAEMTTSQYELKHPWPIWIASVYFVVQALLPIRYHLYPGNIHWTEEGHRLSWKMMLRAKSGFLRLRIINNKTGETKTINPKDYVTPNQNRRVGILPDITWQLIQVIKKDLSAQGWHDIQIYALSSCSLNGHKARPLIDPDYDLAKARWLVFGRNEWILPYDSELQENKK